MPRRQIGMQKFQGLCAAQPPNPPGPGFPSVVFVAQLIPCWPRKGCTLILPSPGLNPKPCCVPGFSFGKGDIFLLLFISGSGLQGRLSQWEEMDQVSMVPSPPPASWGYISCLLTGTGVLHDCPRLAVGHCTKSGCAVAPSSCPLEVSDVANTGGMGSLGLAHLPVPALHDSLGEWWPAGGDSSILVSMLWQLRGLYPGHIPGCELTLSGLSPAASMLAESWGKGIYGASNKARFFLWN